MITINLQSNVSEMIDAVKAAFIERLDGNSWLDKATKEASKEKVRAITKMIAFPDQLYNDTYLNNLYAEVSCSCAMYGMKLSREREILPDLHPIQWSIQYSFAAVYEGLPS